MSILSGTIRHRGEMASAADLREVSLLTERYATGHGVVWTSGRLGMCIQPYASHLRSALEEGPRVDAQGNVLSFDGRLDNFFVLATELGLDNRATSDSEISLAAYQRWGEACFARFTGDWALALWSEKQQTLYLARDHAGTRTLFYRCGTKEMSWATYLETLVGGTQSATLSQDYLAASLASQQVRELTPYEGVRSVPPGHAVLLCDGALTVRRHWYAFDKAKLQYASDSDYDEGFLALFRQAVARRSEEGESIVAELSGGMDSTSIVCISDELRRMQNPDAVLLDTVSYYDDEEASLDERKYFSITEAKRGKQGMHLEMTYSQRTFLPHDSVKGTYLVPGADSLSIVREEQFEKLLSKRDYRAILSGTSGDELLGGVPDCNPELSGYFVSGHWGRFIRQSVAWSLMDRTPLIQTISRAIRYSTESYFGREPNRPIPPWLSKSIKEIAYERSSVLSSAVSRYGREPSQIDNERTWWSIMEGLPHLFPRVLARPEYRYPYLDKDLVEYLLRLPRAQLLKPGRRRFLMRRALQTIVPEEILERKQKAFQLRAPLLKLQQSQAYLHRLFADSILVQMGCIDADSFLAAAKRASTGDTTFWFALMQTIAMELWLQSNYVVSATKNATAASNSAVKTAATEFRLHAQISA